MTDLMAEAAATNVVLWHGSPTTGLQRSAIVHRPRMRTMETVPEMAHSRIIYFLLLVGFVTPKSIKSEKRVSLTARSFSSLPA